MKLTRGKSAAIGIASLALALLATSGCHDRRPRRQSQAKSTSQNSQPQPLNSSLIADAQSPAFQNCNQLEIHYSPEENLEQIDADLLASAEGEVELTAYSFTDRRIVKVLEERASKGVTIRIYSDHASTKEELSRARGEEAGILELARTPNIEVRVKRSSTPAHMKAYEVDGRVLRTGSSNFSASAEKRQDNDLLLLRNPASIGQYRAKFKEMWEREDNEVIQSGSEQPTD